VTKEFLCHQSIFLYLQCSSYIPGCADGTKPVVGMSFDSIKSVKKFYKSYAHKGKFSVSIGPQHLVIHEVVSKKFLCSRQGFKKTNVPPTVKQKNSTETRCGCDAHISVKLGMNKRYFIALVVEEHNHILVSPNKTQFLFN
jgi:zinc finger SWIM domain-containing protein 3